MIVRDFAYSVFICFGLFGMAFVSAASAQDTFYEYDTRNRLTRVQSGLTEVLYDYDAAGNRTQIVVPEPAGIVPFAVGAWAVLLLARVRSRRLGQSWPSVRADLTWTRSLVILLCLAPVVYANAAIATELPGFAMGIAPQAVAYPVGSTPPSPTSVELNQSLAVQATPPAATQVNASTEVTPEIRELARALKHDVDLIYEFVHNQIEYTPVWGSHKGAMGTLLDREGGDFDQASLMIALLRESGYTASFVYGQLRIDGATAINWLGISDHAQLFANYLAASGRDLVRSQPGS